MTKHKIMVVDDAVMMRITIRNMLSKDSNLQIIGHASNGKEALSQLSKLRPDLILLDIEMPEMDGLEFLRHAQMRSKAKVLVLSSVTAAGSEKATRARKLGADAVISKPSGAISFDLEQERGTEIMKTIHNLLGIK